MFKNKEVILLHPVLWTGKPEGKQSLRRPILRWDGQVADSVRSLGCGYIETNEDKRMWRHCETKYQIQLGFELHPMFSPPSVRKH